jgi:Ino eighty subunit 1
MATPPPPEDHPTVQTSHDDGNDSDATQPLRDDGDSPAKDTQNSSPKKEGASDDEAAPQYTATTTTTRRNANGSVSSVYSGNKIRHLKKPDGIPLWRKDIQYDFLKIVFTDEQRVFHKASDESGGHTFADIYLDAMAKSSKCSKILKEKLLTDRPAAVNMAMVCLLVNVGRMNTTLNCK